VNENENTNAKVMATAVTVVIFSIFLIVFLYKNPNSLKNNAKDNNLISLDSYSPVIDLKNSDDEIINQILNGQEEKPIAVDPEKDNLTEVTARDIFTYSQYARTSNSVSAETAGESLSENVKSVITAKETTNFNLIATPTSADYKTYGNAVAALHVALLRSGGKEIQYMNEYTLKEDVKALAPLKEIQASVESGCIIYKQVSIPKDFYDLHKKLVFLCDQYNIILESFIGSDDDPIKAISALNIYQNTQTAIIKNITDYADKFNTKNIVFKPSELGYIYLSFKK
jgi:hypothetical protein